MRVACLAASRVPSRTANSIQALKVAEAIGSLGHEVVVLLPGPDPRVPWADLSRQYALRRSLDLHWLPSAPWARRYDFALRAVAEARNWGADLLYAWPVPAAAWAARGGLPTLLEVHAPPSGLGRLWFASFLGAPGARRVAPISRALETRLRRDYRGWSRGPGGPILPMAVDIEAYRNLPSPAKARARLGWPERLTVGYTGQLYPGRGAELMFGLAERRAEVSFVWAGGEDEAVNRWRKAAESRANLSVLGFIDRESLPLVQAGCDVLLMPYARHVAVSSGGDTADFASPMKAYEYMASGRAILTSDLPAIREILHEGIARFVAPEDVEGWHQALGELLEDAGMRARLGEAAKAEASQHTWRARAQRALEGLG